MAVLHDFQTYVVIIHLPPKNEPWVTYPSQMASC
jgi:hypothetical protein